MVHFSFRGCSFQRLYTNMNYKNVSVDYSVRNLLNECILLAYADDLVVLASTWVALQLLLDRLLKYCIDLDMKCNFKKTVCGFHT